MTSTAPTTEQASREEIVNQIEQLRDSVSGISIDEEAAMMMRYQRAYEANARFFTVIDETIADAAVAEALARGRHVPRHQQHPVPQLAARHPEHRRGLRARPAAGLLRQADPAGERRPVGSRRPGCASVPRSRASDRYREANDSVDSRLRVTDTVLSDIISSITTAQTKGASGRTTVLTAEQREAVALEIEGAKQAIFTAVNTSYRGIYLFAGADNTTAPYTKAGDARSRPTRATPTSSASTCRAPRQRP